LSEGWAKGRDQRGKSGPGGEDGKVECGPDKAAFI
jgi:hypothetical protein